MPSIIYLSLLFCSSFRTDFNLPVAKNIYYLKMQSTVGIIFIVLISAELAICGVINSDRVIKIEFIN